MINRKHILPLMLTLATLGACDDDPVEPDPADSVVAIRLVIGAQTITVNQAGTVTGGPVVIPATGAVITGTFLDSNGLAVAVPSSEFQLNVATDNAARVTFTRTSAFAGTLTRVSAGTAVLTVSLFHIGEAHDDFGPFTIPVTVQ